LSYRSKSKDEGGGMKDGKCDGEVSLSSPSPHPSSLHTDHLLDLGDDFDQVFLVLHHRFDRFVSAGNFIQYACVLATFNARGLLREIFTSEVTFRCSA